jgi:hypothetical protein
MDPRQQAMFDIISFLRNRMKAMSKADKDHMDTILSEHPDISAKELVDYWVELVYESS